MEKTNQNTMPASLSSNYDVDIFSHISEVSELGPMAPYVDEDHHVDFDLIVNDSWLFDHLLEMENQDLSKLHGFHLLAFWMNAYNLFLIKAVFDEHEQDPGWDGHFSDQRKKAFFQVTTHKIAGIFISLNQIVTTHIVGQFHDPRVFFAIDCGFGSCPVLFDRLFHGDTLDSYLDKLCQFNLNDSGVIYYDTNENVLLLTPLFQQHKSEFDATGGIKKFIRQYWDGNLEILDNAKIVYMHPN